MTIKELLEEYYSEHPVLLATETPVGLIGFACRIPVSQEITDRIEKVNVIKEIIKNAIDPGAYDDLDLIAEALRDLRNDVLRARQAKISKELDQEAKESGEKWKAIPGYDKKYEVSNLGRIKGKRDRILSGIIGTNDYLTVNLHKGGKTTNELVHRLVASAFIPNPDNKPYVNHIDENRMNNRVDNLEWVTEKENSNHGTANDRRRSKKCKPVACYNDRANTDLVQTFDNIQVASEWIFNEGKSKSTQAASNNISFAICKKRVIYGYYWKSLDKK